MTWSPVGSFIESDSLTFSLTPGGVGDLIPLEVRVGGGSDVWCTGILSSNVTWEQVGDVFQGTTIDNSVVMFEGTVTSTDEDTVTITLNGSPAGLVHAVGHEFSSTSGSWAVDAQGHLDTDGTDTWASLTPSGPGGLYFGYAINQGSSLAGTTSGYTYNDNVDGQENGAAFNENCDASAQAPVWGDSTESFGLMVLFKELGSSGTPSISGALSLKKMVIAGTGGAPPGITVTVVGTDGGGLSEAPSIGDTLLLFIAMYDVSTGHSSDPVYDGGSVAGTVQLWEVQNTGTADNMYSSAWLLPNLQSSSTDVGVTSSGGNYPNPDGAFTWVKITGLGPSPSLDRVITNAAANGDGSIGPTSAIRDAKELIIAHSAIYGSWPDDGPGSPWTSSADAYGAGGHGIVSYQIADSSGGTYSWAETGNGNPWAGGIATIAATADSDSISGAIVLKKMVISGTSTEKTVVTGSVKLKKMVLSGVSAEKTVVTGSVKLKKMVLSGVSAEKTVVTGSVKLKKMVLSGVSAEKTVVTGSVKLKKMVLSGVSAEKTVVTGSVKLKKMVLSGSSTKTVSATGSVKLKKMVLSGISHEKSVITATLLLKKMVLTAAGTEKPEIAGVIRLKKFVISASSHEKAVVTGVIQLHKIRIHGQQAKPKASNLFVFAPP